MQVKDLISTINIFNAKIIYDKPEEVMVRIMSGESPLYFIPVEGKERKKYEADSNEEFTSTTAAIHIIDLSVEGLVNIFECDGTGIHQFTKQMIEPYCNEEIQRDIVYVVFLFLHEVGHWIQFEKMNKKVTQFLTKDAELEKENFDKVCSLMKQQQERINRGNPCGLTVKERRLFEQYMYEYRNIPKEKEADEFALSKMREVLNLYTKFGLSNVDNDRIQ